MPRRSLLLVASLAGVVVGVLVVVLVRRPAREPALAWDPCPPGHMRRGHGCGEGVRWREALAACAPPRRLPTEGELRALMGPTGCRHAAACRALYGEDDGIYWSSSVEPNGEVRVAWFFDGNVTSDPPSSLNLVKCVSDSR